MFKKAMMTLQHVNLRREGDEDTAETAVDLKLRGACQLLPYGMSRLRRTTVLPKML